MKDNGQPIEKGLGMTDQMTDVGANARQQLRSIVERIERLEEDKKTIADDIKDIYAEAKGQGYDCKALRKIIAIRKQDPNDRAEQEAILDTYLQALGMAPQFDFEGGDA